MMLPFSIIFSDTIQLGIDEVIYRFVGYSGIRIFIRFDVKSAVNSLSSITNTFTTSMHNYERVAFSDSCVIMDNIE